MSVTLHLMTQRGQPYGSERRCCERCGLMLVNRPDSFWRKHTWTDEPRDYRRWADGEAATPDDLVPCDQRTTANSSPLPNTGLKGNQP